MTGTSGNPLRIAILINGYESAYKPLTLTSFKSALTTASRPSPSPSIDFYDPIVAQTYPDPEKYDLIILSGGSADPMGSDPWVLKLQDYLRETVAQYPKQKLVGICWGHQTLSVTFGGTVGSMESAELGVNSFSLTEQGTALFSSLPSKNLRIHEFHRREITSPAKDFIPLAEQNQSFVNTANTILTFQGHPELNPDLARAMLDAAPSYMGVEGARKKDLFDKLEDEHDGVDVLRRVLAWVKE